LVIFLSIIVIVIAIFISSKISKTIANYTDTIENLNLELENSMKIISEYVVISKTDLKGKITYASDAFCKLSGYSREELIGKPHNIVRHPDMPKSAFKDLWDTIKQNNTWTGEVKNLRKDGTFYWFIANIAPDYDNNGQKIGYMAVRTDITAKKQYEIEHKRLMQSEKLASMGELIGNIAHQWRQPLSIITTYASTIKLKKEYGMLNDEELIKYTDSIEQTAQKLSKTIDSFQILVNDDKVKTLFNLNDEIFAFNALVKEDIKKYNINIIYDIEMDKAIEVFGYENDLTKCYINIFNNAKDIFISKNIEEKLIFMEAKQIENDLVISITDNAGGIDDKNINKIFEPYWTTKHQSQGTGLGLSMVYNLIVNEMNGNIDVENTTYTYNNKKYMGAKFIIKLPLA